jgi:quercetin dioxygenase-like cupin family protein
MNKVARAARSCAEPSGVVCYAGERCEAGEVAVHEVRRRGEIVSGPVFGARGDGFLRAPLVCEGQHMTLDFCSLEPGGSLDLHLHSCEESFFVLTGRPVVHLEERSIRLAPGGGGIVPVGVSHGWVADGDEPATWIEMTAPRRRGADEPPDTFFLGAAIPEPPAPLDVRDPRNRHLFLFVDGQLDVERSRTHGTSVDEAAVSASIPTALLAYSGIGVKMLVDERLGAQLHTMFVVEYQPGGVAHPHDHPFEEAYHMLEGEIAAVADGAEYTLEPGDTLWTGVGCIHGFVNRSGRRVRWLETTAPQPPSGHSYRFNRDWEYLAAQLEGIGGGTRAELRRAGR